MRPIPYVCPVCPESMVETEDGSARGYYGVLVKDGKPMVGNGTVRSLTCPNDETPLVPAGVGAYCQHKGHVRCDTRDVTV